MNEATGGMRVAFFGGSFDPPHMGHLAVARAACAALGLHTILFAPVGSQPLKPEGASAGFEDRVAMTRLAIGEETCFELSLVDAPKPDGTPNYTLATLLKLRQELLPDSTLFCLMGADAFFGLKGWRGAAEIPFIAPMIVASRPGLSLDNLRGALPPGVTLESGPADVAVNSDACAWQLGNSAGERAPLYLLPGLQVEVSASEIRRQIREVSAGRTAASGLLPGPVAEYIHSHDLYE